MLLHTEAFTHLNFDAQMLLHTLAQKYLIELLMCNASYVQKHLSKPDRNGLDD